MRAMWSVALALAAVCGVGARPLSPHGGEYPEVTSVNVLRESLIDHRTHLYRLAGGFVVRRGDRFTLEVETSMPLDEDEVIEMLVDEEGHKPEFASSRPRRVGRHTYQFHVYTKTEDPIGKYTNVRFQVQEEGRIGRVNGHVFEYGHPVYLIFNPYHSDEVHHIGDPGLTDENLLHEWGPVYTGTIREYSAIHWYYGQFDQKALDTAFRMLEPMPRKDASDVVETMQFLSHNIGCANQTKPVGNWNGVLYGRWFQDFPGGVAPGTWSSTIDIIDVWKKQGEKPAKYGQCWVFAAVQQTYFRTLGIPARQVTALEAMIGKAEDPVTGINHHVVNYFYDKSGKIVHKEGHCWNFHSWNDVHIKRKDDRYSGWNVVDGTPTGKGPGSVRAILDVADQTEFNTSKMIDSVHATVRWFLVECTKELNMTTKGQLDPSCKAKKQLKYNHEGVRVVVTKQPSRIPRHHGEKGDDDQHFQEYDITRHYVNPEVDAYIPEKGYPPFAEDLDWDAANGATDPLSVSIITEGFSVVVGQPVTATVSVSLPSTYNFPADGIEVSVGVGGEVRAYDEGLVKDLQGAVESVKLTKEQPSAQLTLTIDPTEYLVENMHDLHVEMRAVASTDGSAGLASIDMAKIALKSAPLSVRVPPLVAPKLAYANEAPVHDVTIPVSNLHDFPLENVCVDMFTPDLAIIGDRLHCVNLEAGETKLVTKQFEAPEESGRYPVTFVMYGPYTPTVRAKYDIVVADDDDHMRLSQL